MEKKYLGSMIDCSRNAVMKVSEVKRYIDCLEKMGYNMLMLYTEETYELDNQPMFGYLRGRYSREELKEMVQYGEEHGIELIPCIQTLGHLGHIFRWRPYEGLCDQGDTLLVDEEKTYELIDSMFKTVKECFHSKKVHIGMDEAYGIGRGRYFDKHGYVDHFDLLERHLKRVSDMAKSYELEPIMWSDMFFALADGQYYHYDNSDVITPEIADRVPEGVGLVYWDYFTSEKKQCDTMLEAHQHFHNPIWFAGGGLTWSGFTPHNVLAQHNLGVAAKSCREHNVGNFIVTCWGDDGNETSKFSVLPTLYYAAERYRGNDDMASIKKGFEKLFGVSFDDFMKLDYPSTKGAALEAHYESPDRHMFYGDPFLGIYEYVITDDYPEWEENYRNHAKELNALADTPTYGYLFKNAAALCEAMSVKLSLGKRTRAAYEAGDKEALRTVREEYPVAIEKIKAFYQTLRYQWMKENKGNGFEVQDIRFGGLMLRLEDCYQTLGDYLDGKLSVITELEEPLQPLGNAGEDAKQYKYGAIVTPARITHFRF